MFDWFDEPIVYYRRFAPMRSGVFDYMSRWMDSVDRAMEEEFGDFYDAFTRRDVPRYEMIEDDNEKKHSKKNNKKNAKSKPKKVEKHEEEEEFEEKSESEEEIPQYYSISSSIYTGSDGIQHIHREEVDSKSGLRKVVDTKRIGNKSLTIHEVTDKDGKVETHQTIKNIREDELEDFKKKWSEYKVPERSSLPEPEKKSKKETKNDEKKSEE
ncbi:cysteine protease, putative [Trichomonas vaginalis G3]|uniref:Cysteine protease, putative n=1 Tax=Trichomonas vaginalis (strain ATCC PRA-98 / G3) TaxID=412133 RepID=A2FYI2_TRIV3|nr:myeloid leukemia factor family [Trichomonas vaginalis G3]EAX90041.1 cysteine protease, putative [Trichomonas vaginalis G3]KAI5552847.1 myeloid leukemia factor family [Trichomonas vaginalis G3]|eukprot:XP_001302971.1 cysteine protease [Trichomonas vaginalis G3]